MNQERIMIKSVIYNFKSDYFELKDISKQSLCFLSKFGTGQSDVGIDSRSKCHQSLMAI